MSFTVCLPVILQSEGGYVDDQGGPTNFGITIPALQAYLHRPVSQADIEALANQPEVVSGLYQADFYNVAHCGDCPAGVDLMVFDEAVNEGPGRSIRHLQESLGVAADGAFGPITLAALVAADPRALIATLHDTNGAYYEALDAEYPQDERGWQARNDRIRDIALTMVGT